MRTGKFNAALIIEPMPRATIDMLFKQALIENYKDEPYLNVLERMVRLVEAEIQGQVWNLQHRRSESRERAVRQSTTADV